jgi:hypothetical protein
MTFWEIALAVALGVVCVKIAPYLLLAIPAGVVWLLRVISAWFEKKP